MNIEEKIVEAIEAYAREIVLGEITGYDLFDMVYGPLPVVLSDSSWEVPGEFDVGVTLADTLSAFAFLSDDDERDGDGWPTCETKPTTLSELAAILNLEPWSLALDYGWEDNSIDHRDLDSDLFTPEQISRAAAALAAAENKEETQEREYQEQLRFEKEEAELCDCEEAELRLIERGESVEWCECDSLEAAAEELGMPTRSETARLYFEGKLPKAEAIRRAEIITHRHEQTNYDELLRSGYDRESARALKEEVR